MHREPPQTNQPAPPMSLQELHNSIGELPVLPTVIARMYQLDSEADDYFEQLVSLASEDPPFAARLLRIANSASSAPVTPVTTIHACASRLGADAVRNMLTMVAVARVFVPSSDAEKLMWLHSIQVACAARHMVRSEPDFEVDPETVYLCGLLHDIGRFIMFEQTPAHLREVEAIGWDTPASLMDAEQQVYAYDHSELGYLACCKWGLPHVIANTVRLHHRVSDARQPNVQALLVPIAIADCLSICLCSDPQFLHLDLQARAQQIEQACMDDAWQLPAAVARNLSAAIPEIHRESQQLYQALGLGNGPVHLH